MQSLGNCPPPTLPLRDGRHLASMELAMARASTHAADNLADAIHLVAEQMQRGRAAAAAKGQAIISDSVVEALALVIRVSGREVRELRDQVATELRRARGERAARCWAAADVQSDSAAAKGTASTSLAE